MKRIDVNLPDEAYDKFMMAAGRRLGAKRGAFTLAVIDALTDWSDPDLAKVVEEYKDSHKGRKGK